MLVTAACSPRPSFATCSCRASLRPWMCRMRWAWCVRCCGPRPRRWCRGACLPRAQRAARQHARPNPCSCMLQPPQRAACLLPPRPLRAARPPCPPAEATQPHQDGAQAAHHAAAGQGGGGGGGQEAARPQVRRGPPGVCAGWGWMYVCGGPARAARVGRGCGREACQTDGCTLGAAQRARLCALPLLA